MRGLGRWLNRHVVHDGLTSLWREFKREEKTLVYAGILYLTVPVMYVRSLLIIAVVVLILVALIAFAIVRRGVRALEWARKLSGAPRPIKKPIPCQLISIIMPALDEEENITPAMRNVLAAFDDLGITGEIVVINDGSTDRTPDLVREESQRDPRIRLVNHDRPAGIGGAFWDGVAHARGEVVCMLPGDNENDPWEILRYHKLLEHVDILIPFVFNKETRSLFRNGLSYLYRFIINTTFLVNFNYTNGTVMYRKKILDELEFHNRGFFFQTDILVRTVKRGYLFAEVPYRLNVRPHGLSKAVTFPSLMRVIKGYLRLVRDIHFSGQRQVPAGYAADSLTAERHGSVPPQPNQPPAASLAEKR
jgi:dolichol-phosphate mannosyltransferase